MRLTRDLGALDDDYDLVVVGGGISGVCVAREAAARGLRALLVDKGDFGAGTSSATSKYLHGGIRYLEQYEFGVVRESLRERRILSLAAPHLVSPMRFVLPAWRWSRPPAWLLGAGVLTYSALGWDKNRNVPPSLRMRRPAWLGRRALLGAVPWLQPEHLLGGFAYDDILNVHPERLLLALLGSAVGAGAVALNHVEVVGFFEEPRPDGVRVRGVEVVDRLGGARRSVRAGAVVNAAGPWMDEVLAALGRPVRVGVRRSKGVHVLVRPLGGRDAVLARAPNGRHVIVSPWMGRSFIGPTDTPMEGRPDDAAALPEDVSSLLETVNQTIGPPSARLTPDDVELTTVGIRPLVVGDGADTYSASRRHELYDHRRDGVHHLWSIGGGKWTTARALAEDVLDTLVRDPALAASRARRARRASTRRAPAAGTFAWAADPGPYLDAAVRGRPDVAVDPEARVHLARLYGTAHGDVLDLVAADPALGRRVSARPGRLDIGAQVVHAVTAESARTLADIVCRRLVLGTLGGVTPGELRVVAGLAAPLLGWDGGRVEAEVAAEAARLAAQHALRGDGHGGAGTP